LVLSGRFGDGADLGELAHPALRQRIPIRCQLDRLSEEQCMQYVTHRLKVAGQPNNLFTEEAVELIAARSKGAPRSINNICDLGLFLGYSRNVVRVDAGIIETVTHEISGSLTWAPSYAR
jgi:type II secretory pathway predicted ATPase ExeA